ncbi:sugar phosphate isomerase/epimerase family protein [Micromonospora auratinigra]|uniref:Sugar phosphate isomerase/epimerase n=1 Tax=Micromonospora auratinigra TaxID=261654 RepID=A0A1A8Z1Q3_9ACTN|nr:sugar phosphate isomerase/epimerase family protein [Micromonospora auratinigra]SBT37691.1 Sugar phosphate isomerase/epimerase [Micromonospora auratinigra]
MKVAVSNIAWEPGDDEKVADALRRAGAEAVEVAPTKVWPDPTAVSPAQAHAYGRAWARAGLPVVAAQSLLYGRPDLTLFGPGREEFVAYLGRIAELGAALGATALVFGSPRNRLRQDLPVAVADRIAVDVFGRLAERAVAAGTTFCVEANPAVYGADYLTRATEAAALVAAVDSPGLRLHLDTACMTLAGEDPAAGVRRFAPLLRHAHLSEPHLAAVGHPDPRHADFAAALRAVDYAGHLSVEMRPSDGDRVAAVERAARYAVALCGAAA